ncbi:MAG: 16S rRNA (uracil(1498)-N(3))-methyltransferase [Bacteroidota bacterium]
MPLPFFYKNTIDATSGVVMLDEDTSKHIVQVLRMQNGEQLQLTDGKGNLFTCEITDNNRKRCTVTIKQTVNQQRTTTNVTIAISLVKNSSRFEWFLEKATEIGITEIIPLICTRTEKQNFRHDRMNGILISAMLQSQQTWLPILHEPVKFNEAVNKASQQQKFIAHCEEENNKVQLTNQLINKSTNKLILIGPEGDFTKEEIDLALQKEFTPVALGDTRLRTETAGIVAATLLRLV